MNLRRLVQHQVIKLAFILIDRLTYLSQEPWDPLILDQLRQLPPSLLVIRITLRWLLLPLLIVIRIHSFKDFLPFLQELSA